MSGLLDRLTAYIEALTLTQGRQAGEPVPAAALGAPVRSAGVLAAGGRRAERWQRER